MNIKYTGSFSPFVDIVQELLQILLSFFGIKCFPQIVQSRTFTLLLSKAFQRKIHPQQPNEST